MTRLDDQPKAWRYGIRWGNAWAATVGGWQSDKTHPAVLYWPTMQQASDWRDRHMPGVLDAWAEAIGIFQGQNDVTREVMGVMQ